MKNLTQTMLANLPMTSAQTSQIFDIRQIYCFAIQYTTSGTVSSTLVIEVSCDPQDHNLPPNPTNWATAIAAITLNAVGSAVVNFDGIGASFVRVRTTVGTGNIIATISAKG